MRILAARILPCALIATTACAHGAHFYPAAPDEAVPGHPEAAAAEAAGVRLTVHAGDWHGAPEDLEQRLTPVEVFVDNESGRTIRVGPDQYGLLAPNGFRYQAMDARDVQTQIGQSYRGSVVYYGFYGAYPWPGFWRPYRRRFYPYMGFGGYGAPVAVYEPPPQPPATPRGTLDAGGNVSILLFFPVPATSLGTLEISMDVVDAAGAQLGVVRVPLTAQRPSSPPAPPPQGPPPPPQR